MPDAHDVRLSTITRDECRARADAGGIALVPVAATEQHGPHLPAGTDTITTDYLCVEAAARVAPGTRVVVTPTLGYGCSAHHLPFGATVSLTTQTMAAVVRDIGASLVASGFGRIMFVNGHGGNHSVISAAAADIALDHGVAVAACSWWQLAEDALVQAGALRRGNLPGHAGAFETSIMLVLAPDQVVDDLPSRPVDRPGVVGMRAPLSVRTPTDWVAIDGYSDNPAAGDAADGSRYLEIGVTALADAIREFASRPS